MKVLTRSSHVTSELGIAAKGLKMFVLIQHMHLRLMHEDNILWHIDMYPIPFSKEIWVYHLSMQASAI